MSRPAALSLFLVVVAGSTLPTAGCASVPVVSNEWPPAMPPRGYYELVWEGDAGNREVEPLEEYLAWVVRFYRGSLVAPGWGPSQERLAAGLDASDAMLLAPRLACLGQLVSAEWAKHNERRRITTEMLRTWSRVMAQAKEQGRAIAAVDRLIGDVTALLRGELEPAAIRAERYQEAIATASR